MKKLTLIWIATLLLSTGNLLASTPRLDDFKTNKALAVQIYDMLGEDMIPNEIRGSKAEVRVAVDTGNYLRILSIESENEALKEFIRSRIDFKRLTKGTFEQGIVYRIPIEVRE